MKIIDISPLVSGESPIFPGEWKYEHPTLCSHHKGDPFYLSGVKMSPHVGAHADAPSHYEENAPGIDEVDLLPYLGPCFVVTCKDTRLIEPKHCEHVLAQNPERILFRTMSVRDPNAFTRDFTAIAPATIELLGKHGVLLVGIDTPSVDPAASKTLSAHHALHRWKMRNLENLRLEEVKDGKYELIALPLKLKGADASPVRAVLRK